MKCGDYVKNKITGEIWKLCYLNKVGGAWCFNGKRHDWFSIKAFEATEEKIEEKMIDKII